MTVHLLVCCSSGSGASYVVHVAMVSPALFTRQWYYLFCACRSCLYCVGHLAGVLAVPFMLWCGVVATVFTVFVMLQWCWLWSSQTTGIQTCQLHGGLGQKFWSCRYAARAPPTMLMHRCTPHTAAVHNTTKLPTHHSNTVV